MNEMQKLVAWDVSVISTAAELVRHAVQMQALGPPSWASYRGRWWRRRSPWQSLLMVKSMSRGSRRKMRRHKLQD
jgi:hypothetical protein